MIISDIGGGREEGLYLAWYKSLKVYVLLSREKKTPQKIKFPVKGFFSKCDQFRSFLENFHIY